MRLTASFDHLGPASCTDTSLHHTQFRQIGLIRFYRNDQSTDSTKIRSARRSGHVPKPRAAVFRPEPWVCVENSPLFTAPRWHPRALGGGVSPRTLSSRPSPHRGGIPKPRVAALRGAPWVRSCRASSHPEGQRVKHFEVTEKTVNRWLTEFALPSGGSGPKARGGRSR